MYANQLYNEGKPYEALPYYQNILDYKDVATSKLQRNAYIIIGKWKSEKGIEMIFSSDGSCVVDGIKGYYAVLKYGMFTGEQADELQLTHNIIHLVEDSLTLRTISEDNSITYKLIRQVDNEK